MGFDCTVFIFAGLVQLLLAIPSYINCDSAPIAELSTSSSSIMCPAVANTMSQYICDDSRYTVNPALQNRKQFPYMQFVATLKNNSMKILILGDSLSEHMERAFACSLEEEYIANRLRFPGTADVVLHRRNWYLSLPPPPYGLRSNPSNDFILQDPHFFDDTFRTVVDKNITHLVLNTGAWYAPPSFNIMTDAGLQNLTKHSEVVSVFEAVFALDGQYVRMLKELHEKHGVTIIWRDLAPAGVCGQSTR